MTNSSSGSNNKSGSGRMAVPEAKDAMNRFKEEVASELGVPLKDGYNGDLTSRQAGSIGGEMVKKMIQKQEEQMRQSYPLHFSIEIAKRKNPCLHSHCVNRDFFCRKTASYAYTSPPLIFATVASSVKYLTIARAKSIAVPIPRLVMILPSTITGVSTNFAPRSFSSNPG